MKCGQLADKATRDSIARTLAYFRKDLTLVVILLSLIACSTALGFLQAWPLAVLVDTALGPTIPDGWMHWLFLAPFPEDPVKRIVGLGALALALKLAQELISVARRLLSSRIHYNGLLRVRCHLYRKLQALHLDYHRSQPLGDPLFRLTTDTLGFQAVLTVAINLLFAVLSLMVLIGLLLARSVPLTLIALSIAPPLLWVNVIFGRRLTERSRKAKESESAFTTSVQRSMSAIVLTQAFGREDDEFQHFGATARRCVRNWFGIHRQEVGYGLSVGAILGIGGSAILSYGGILVYERQITPGELMIFMTYLGMMYDPLCQITGLGFNLQSGLVGAGRVFEVLDRPAAVADASDAVALAVQPRTLKLQDVGFEYRPGHAILRGVTAAIQPGESVAFVGSSGAGKSTLLNLLPRFYDPSTGAIMLDEWDLTQINLRDLRRHIALVSQDSVMLPTTIAENIAYGRPRATPEEIEAAARLAGVSEFVQALPQGYNTQLNDGGLNLSGGQRQRIALARALLTEAPILVLDEPTSALDSRHELLVQETLAMLRGKRTIVLVSHRLMTVMGCDRICVLDHGRIVEQGRHDDLIRRGGVYAEMWRQQTVCDEPVLTRAA